MILAQRTALLLPSVSFSTHNEKKDHDSEWSPCHLNVKYCKSMYVSFYHDLDSHHSKLIADNVLINGYITQPTKGHNFALKLWKQTTSCSGGTSIDKEDQLIFYHVRRLKEKSGVIQCVVVFFEVTVCRKENKN